MRTGHQLYPAFGALRGREPWSVPEQFLLVEAIAMLVRVTQTVDWANLGQRSRLVAFLDKPADAGITLASAGSMADDLNERKFHPTSVAPVQVVPTMNLDLCTFVIGAFPGFIGLAMAVFIAALKTLPILAAGSLLSREPLWGRAVKDAIAFDTQ